MPPEACRPRLFAASGTKKFAPPESKISVAGLSLSETGTTIWPTPPARSPTNGIDTGAVRAPCETYGGRAMALGWRLGENCTVLSVATDVVPDALTSAERIASVTPCTV